MSDSEVDVGALQSIADSATPVRSRFEAVIDGMNVEQIAIVCHETNASFCRTLCDGSQQPWDAAEEWQRESARAGVRFALNNPNAPASFLHDEWLADKACDGWKYGPVKNATAKEHPCFVPYEALPIEQQLKDYLFKAVVRAFVDAHSANAAASQPVRTAERSAKQ